MISSTSSEIPENPTKEDIDKLIFYKGHPPTFYDNILFYSGAAAFGVISAYIYTMFYNNGFVDPNIHNFIIRFKSTLIKK